MLVICRIIVIAIRKNANHNEKAYYENESIAEKKQNCHDY